MLKKLTKGTVLSAFIVGVPCLGNRAMLHAPHLWVLLATGVLASVLQPDYNPFTIATRPKDKHTGAAIIWAVYLTQLAAVCEATWLRYPQSVRWDAISTLSLFLMVGGLALRTWAVCTLRDCFTMHIAVSDTHTLVRKGPYRVVRHPSYLGALALYVSTTLLIHAWFSALAAIIILAAVFLRRVHYEEKALLTAFGAEFESYRRETGGILPRLPFKKRTNCRANT